MSLIHVENVRVLNNPARFTDPFQFEITFECIQPGPKDDIEWKLVYVGSAEDEKFDQDLDSVLVGPIAVGKNKFVFQAPAPDPSKIPSKDLLEVTALILIGLYKDREFIRVGYFVRNFLEGFEHRSLEEFIPSSTNPKAISALYQKRLDGVTDENKQTVRNSIEISESKNPAKIGKQEAATQLQPPSQPQQSPPPQPQESASSSSSEKKVSATETPESSEMEGSNDVEGDDIVEDENEEEEEEEEEDINDMEEVPDFNIPEPVGPIDISKVFRNINPQPRVTRFQIPWDTPQPAPVPSNLSNHSGDGEVLPQDNPVAQMI